MSKLAKIVDALMDKSHQKAVLKILQTVFNKAIAFNGPHKFEFLEIGPEKTKLGIPHIRNNQNHLGTVHACAMATAGEYSAGLLLVKNFSMQEYRYVLSSLEVDYKKQGVGKLTAQSVLALDDIAQYKLDLEKKDAVFVKMETEITNQKGEHLCLAKTCWQIKKWNKARSQFE